MSGRTIRTLRSRKEMAQSEVARKAGVSKAAVTHLETGRRRLTVNLAKKIAPALGTDPLTLAVRVFGQAEDHEEAAGAVQVIFELAADPDVVVPDRCREILVALGFTRRLAREAVGAEAG